jgi:hypothetical protein
VNFARDHHFHGNPERRFTLQNLRAELRLRELQRQPTPKAKHWKQQPLFSKGPTNVTA